MGVTFYQLWNELLGEVGNDVPVALAKKNVNYSWQEILNQRPWSFLLAEGILQAPAMITGTITFTQYSQICVPDAALKAQLDALTSEPLLTRRSMRRYSNDGVISGVSLIFDIYGYDPSANSGAGEITLSRPWQEASGAQTMVIYRRYFLSPLNDQYQETNDFVSFVSVKDQNNNVLLDKTKNIQYLDRIDPNRVATGTPQAIVQGPINPNTFPGTGPTELLAPGTPLYELWPHYIGSTARTYVCLYQRRGLPLTDDFGTLTSTLPYQIDPELVIAGARKRIYRWAEINKGRIPALRSTDWKGLMKEAQEQWESLYLDMRRRDEEIYQQNYIPTWGAYLNTPFGFGADYIQSHAGPYGWNLGSYY